MSLKIGDRVSFDRMNYIAGGILETFQGVIVDIEYHNPILSENRYGIEVENNPFPFPVPYFYARELNLIDV